MVGLHVGLEYRHNRRADRGSDLDVAIDELDVRIDDRQLTLRRATEQITRTRRALDEERTQDHMPRVRRLTYWSNRISR